MSAHVFVLGAGRAGLGLARALRASGVTIAGVHGRAGGSARLALPDDRVSTGRIPDQALATADTVLVTVRDAQMDEALRELAAAAPPRGAVVLHASGSAEPEALRDLRTRGHPAGTFHPLVPLVDPASAPVMLHGAWIGVDGDPLARERGRHLATRIGANVLEIPPGQKARYHAAAVVASNFPAVLLSIGERLLHETGVDAAAAGQALRPLFYSAAENLRGRTPAEALTGPVVRGDVDTVRGHVRALGSDGEALAVYRALTRAALVLARERGVDERVLDEIARAVE